jgi:glycosyltransferase involved in cell wall biosynthesis
MSGLATLSLLVVVVLGWFSLRRLVFLVGALMPARQIEDRAPEHAVTVVVPAHDEGSVVDRLLQSLERLEYPPELLRFVLVSDGSRDGTAARFHDWAKGRHSVEVVELPDWRGKGEALRAGLRRVDTELVVVLDADLEPQPDLLRRLLPVFADASVGAATAFVRPRQVGRSAVGRYAAVTAWVHQLVTSAAKDRLSLNPSTLGASCYRRAALEQAGGFDGAAVADPDTAAAVAVTRLGWTTRFVPSAIADHPVYSTLGHYWHQHLRWTRGAISARPRRTTASKERLPRRVETWSASTGYLDRAVLLVAAALVGVGALPWWTLGAYLALPALQVVVALGKAGELRHAPGYLMSIVPVFAVDVAASVVGLFAHLRGRQLRWESRRAATAVKQAAAAPGACAEQAAEPELACAVLSYRDEPGVVDAVRSLLAQSAAVEIVVVNSGGGDPALRLAEAGLDVPVVNAPHRLYPGAARNVGIEQTRARYVSFLAADCLAGEHWAEARLRAHRAGADAVASCLSTPNGDGASAAASLLLLHNRRVAVCPPGERLLYGLSYERALFERHGRFREDLRGGEDTEFNARLQGVARIAWSDDVRTAHRFPMTLRLFLRELHRRGRLEATVHGKLRNGGPSGLLVATRACRNILRALRFTLRFAPGERAPFVRAWPLVVCGGIVYAAGALRAYVHPYDD